MGRLEFLKKQLTKYPENAEVLTLIPKWVEFGENINIHKGVFFSSSGFGYEKINNKWVHIPHSGKVIISDNVDIFSGTNIVRATADDGITFIGKGTKIDYNCHIAHNVKIGKNCLVVAGTILCGSVEIGDNCYLGIGCMIKNKVKIGNNVTVGMGAVVLKDVPDGQTVIGNPAKIFLKKTNIIYKEFQYDFCIIISTYNRESMLKLLLNDIFEQKNKYKILITIFDDGSSTEYDLSEFDVKYIKYYKNHGKEKYWSLVNDTLKYCQKIDSKYYIYLPDDIRLKNKFFIFSAKILEGIPNETNLLTLLLTKQRLSKPQWTNFIPIEHTNYYQIQWVDMCFICKRNVLEALEFNLLPISENRWKNNSNLSSGVGRQMTIRLNELGFKMHQVKKTIVAHKDHISRMNNNERKLNPLTT